MRSEQTKHSNSIATIDSNITESAGLHPPLKRFKLLHDLHLHDASKFQSMLPTVGA